MIKSRTFIATPPGATIKEQLVDRGMKQKEFAARMNMSEKHISKLINGEVILTPEVAIRLEMVLGLPARFWNNLENLYREKLLLVEAENSMEEDIKIAKKFPYREMQKHGWVEEVSKQSDKVFSLRKYFEVVQLTMVREPLIPGIACRRQSVTEKADYALIAWSQKAKLEARSIQTKVINLQKLRCLLPEIRNMTNMNQEEFRPQLCLRLSECGIALIFLPHIGGSFLHGATFYDKNKIVIGITARGKKADIFWFSLFHELGHILLGHINQAKGTTEDDEKAADEFARDVLISEDKYKEYVANNNFTIESVRRFASSIGIDSGIVVGRLQKEGYLPYNKLNSLRVNL